MYFISLFRVATAVVDDGVGPSPESLIASYDAALRAVNQELQTLPPAIDYSQDIINLRKEKDLNPSSETGELQAEINDVRQLASTNTSCEVGELQSQIDNVRQTSAINPSCEVGELQAQIDNVRQEVEVIPLQQIGTLAAVNIDSVPYLGFSTPPSWIGSAAGQFWYDPTTGSFNAKMGNNNITQQVGEELFIYGKASAAITEGQLICKTGTVGASGVITFGPSPTGLIVNDGIIGVATENIALNAFGRITSFGVVHGINTTGASVGETWADNDTLYYNPSYVGGLTNVKPSAPYTKFEVGTVINAGSGGSGSIQVDLIHGSVLGGTDSNVQFGTLANGNIIQYNSTLGYWTNVTLSAAGIVTYAAPVTYTANFSVAATDTWIINNKSGSSCTATLPAASSYTGRILRFQNYQAQTLISASSNVVPLVGGAAGTAILAAVAGDTATLVSDGSNWIMTQYTPNNVLLLE